MSILHDSIEKYLNHLLHSTESTDENVVKSLFDKLIEKVVVYDDKVVLHLIVNFYDQYGDNLPNGQPQFTLMADIEKDKMRY